jgi:AsmA family protein
VFRLPRLGRKTKILLGLCIALAIAAALFDWNWFRHPFEQYLIDRSHREIRIGDLHVDLGWSLEPTVRVRGVYVENAPWADKRPAAIAGEASFTFSLKSLWQGHAVISRLVLIDADIDLERQADGLRNWRLRNPADRGPGRVKVLRLEPHRTKIRLIRRDIDFDVVLTASSTEPGASGQPPDASHPTRIDFKGKFGGTEFSGDVLTGELLTFLETGESFALRGHASAGKSRLDVDGTVADLFGPSAMDAKVRLAGPSLSKLQSFLRVPLPDSRPYEIETRLRQSNDEFSGTELRAKVGATDLAGEVSFNRGGERPMLRAQLRSDSAGLSDLGSLLGLGHAPGQAERKPGGSERILPSAKINLEHLNALDAHVSLDARKLTASDLPALESLRFSVALENGILILKPIHVGLAGGQVTGWLTLDGQQQPATAQAKLELQGIRLEKLLATLQDVQFNAGTIAARLDLRGHGASVATILGAASGTLAITMDDGRISNLLDAKLGLNLGKVLRLLVAGDRAIEINSLDVAFDFDKGSGTSTNMILDTAQTRVTGTGKINLRDETVDLLLTPNPKKPGVFSLRSSSIHVDGSLRHPQFEIVKKSE